MTISLKIHSNMPRELQLKSGISLDKIISRKIWLISIQCKFFIHKLMNPPVVDSSRSIDITEIDEDSLPIITMCITNQGGNSTRDLCTFGKHKEYFLKIEPNP